jgi:hypothetical protein
LRAALYEAGSLAIWADVPPDALHYNTSQCHINCTQVDIMPDMLNVIVGMCKMFHMQVIDLSQRFLEHVSNPRTHIIYIVVYY